VNVTHWHNKALKFALYLRLLLKRFEFVKIRSRTSHGQISQKDDSMKLLIQWTIVAIIGCGPLEAFAGQKIIECKLDQYEPSTRLTIPVKFGNRCKWQCACSGDPGQKQPHKQECPEGEKPIDNEQTCAVREIFLDIFTEVPGDGECPTSIDGTGANNAKTQCRTACLAQFPKDLVYECEKKSSGSQVPPRP
jgi:hypothetical protein